VSVFSHYGQRVGFEFFITSNVSIALKTSLLRRLQAQTLPDEAPPIGKIHSFSKMAVTFKPMMGF
jgi:hypothetical protein